jgi:molecular chaperone DnaJ
VRDPYEVLGVNRSATQDEIKTAFKRLAVQHHPDKNSDSAEAHQRFTELNHAYQILSDPEKRATYDRFGNSAFQPGGPGVNGFDFSGLDSVFGDILGAFGIRTGDRGDIKKHLRLTFEESVRGCDREISYERTDACDACRGSGAEPGTSVHACPACGGRGRVRFQQGLFPLAVERPCSRCNGSGGLPDTPCRRCRGAGLAKQTRTLEVSIPAGIEPGSSRIVEHAGNRIRPDRPAGNLEVVVDVDPHPFFRRAGDDILCTVPVTFVQAALGGEVEVPTIEGKVALRIPPATQPGAVLRVRGKGVAHRVRGGRGDQLVEVSVEVPTALSPRARQLLEELGNEMGESVQPGQRSFVEKLKDLLG